jgi:hypothetical protein
MNLLADYMPRATLADQLGVCERSIARYENEPDGLPSTTIGGRKMYRLDSVRSWLAAREYRPNQRRRAG